MGASSHQEKDGKIGGTQRPQQSLGLASSVFLLSCSFYFLHGVVQDCSSDQSVTKGLYASNSRPHADHVREEKHRPHSSGRRNTEVVDSGPSQSWLLLAELGGPISAGNCSNRPLRPLKRTWFTESLTPTTIKTGLNVGSQVHPQSPKKAAGSFYCYAARLRES